MPIVIDATRDADALAPDEFRAVLWTRLPDGAPPPQFVERVRKLLAPDASPVGARLVRAQADRRGPATPLQKRPRPWLIPSAVLAVAAIATSLWLGRPASETSPTPDLKRDASATTAPASASAPSPNSQLPSTSGRPQADQKSLAVLPFANLSTEKENEFFADGMHDELLTALAKVGALKVISRTSVLAYRDPAKRGLTLRQIAAELGVANILEGTVSRAAGSVRIKVKLIDAATDQPRWEDTINLKAVTDVFQAQADISAQIAQALAATLSPELKLALAMKLTTNPAANDLYLRARRWREMSVRELGTTAKYDELAVAPLEQAVALDPNFAAAYAELSQIHAHLYWFLYHDPTPARLAKAKAAVDKALLIDPALPAVRNALGYYHYVGSLDYARATEEYAIALAAMPGDADLLYNLAATQRRQGRWADATVNLERAFALNPRNRTLAYSWVECLLAQRLYARAEQTAERVLAINPARPGLLRMKAQARFARDGDRARYRSALAAIPVATGGEPPDPRIRQFREAIDEGRHADAVRIFESAPGLIEPDSPDFFDVVAPNLSRYFSAASAIGEREKVRVRALAALAATSAESTERYYEWRRVARLAMLNAHAGQPDEARRHAPAPWS